MYMHVMKHNSSNYELVDILWMIYVGLSAVT